MEKPICLYYKSCQAPYRNVFKKRYSMAIKLNCWTIFPDIKSNFSEIKLENLSKSTSSMQ